MTNKKGLEFDDVLHEVGSYGPYQLSLSFWVVFLTSFFMAISVQLFVFITVVPDYWCHVPGRELTNYTETEWIELTIPTVNGTKDKCHYYDVTIENGEVSVNESNVKECSSWDHDDSQFVETLATSKEWFCEKELYSTHLLSVQMGANAFGMAVLPVIADKITGRRLMFFISCAFVVVFSIPILFIDNFWIILTTRFLAGFALFVSYQMPFIICLELISLEKRALTSFYSFLAWTFGMCSNALIAWLIPHWWFLSLITTLAYASFFGLWWLLPESPRYLLFRNRIEECADILMKVAKVNKKKDVSRNVILKELKLIPKDDDSKLLREMVKYPRLLFMILNLTLISVATFIGYGCVIYNIKVLPNNYFLAHFVLSLFELPSNIIGWLSTHYLGRKYTSFVSALILIPFCGAAPFFLEEPYVMLALASMIKVFNSIIVFAIYVLTPEIFPTTVRSTVFGVVQLCGTIGIAVVPYLIMLEDGLHYWILFGFSIMMVILSIFLPETIGLPLPQTFLEADHQIKFRSRLRWINHWNKDRFKPPPLHKDSEELTVLNSNEENFVLLKEKEGVDASKIKSN